MTQRPPLYTLFMIFAQLFAFVAGILAVPASSSSSSGLTALPTKLQKELGMALEALRESKLLEARKHLDVVYRVASSDAETNFLLGIYSTQTNDWAAAKTFFGKTLAASPNHLGALLFFGNALLREQKPAEAARYFSRAVELEPTSWRAHAALADACIRQGLFDDSISEAERALELGHSRAEIVLPLLARALQLRGDEQRAASILQTYLQGHGRDDSAPRILAHLSAGSPDPGVMTPSSPSAELPSAPPVLGAPNFLLSRWLPPDVDEITPPLEPNIPCDLSKIMEQSGRRVQEFIESVERFTATEAIIHESVNKWGLTSRPKQLDFDYLVSIKEIRRGMLSVEEYRNSHHPTANFPDGVAITGLPALILIFHPYYAQNFSMTCEGLGRSKGQAAWQIYFRQRPDKPSVIRSYQVGGTNGPVYRVPLKGRAWIAADTFQIVRLETDILNPLPEIRLAADHAAIEYAPVEFRSRGLAMWLPQTAEVFYDWRGRRGHRRHNFGNYLLFSIEDKQQITVPDPVPPNTGAKTPS
jgi:tetratricopeptide (TPR) repeat protein